MLHIVQVYALYLYTLNYEALLYKPLIGTLAVLVLCMPCVLARDLDTCIPGDRFTIVWLTII